MSSPDNAPIVVAPRPFKARLAVQAGIVLAMAGLVSQVLIANDRSHPAPQEPYRVLVEDLTNGQVLSSVYVDPSSLSPGQQLAMMQMTARWADQTAKQTQHPLEMSAYSANGPTQVSALEVIQHALHEERVQTLNTDWSQDAAPDGDRPVGVRFNLDTSPGSLDRVPSDPCFVQTGSLQMCSPGAAKLMAPTLSQAMGKGPTSAPPTQTAPRPRLRS